MMGYADAAADLAAPDKMHGRLQTGDLGYLDAENRLFLTGRTQDFVKVAGLRVDIGAVKQAATVGNEVAVTASESGIVVHFEPTTKCENYQDVALNRLLQTCSIPAAMFRFQKWEKLPRTDRGKINKAALVEPT